VIKYRPLVLEKGEAMAYNFKECNREQIYLMPPSLQEWLPEKDMAWFIIDVVEQMDLSAYYRKYRADGRGQEAYDPSMMVALLLYAYSNGIQSSRAIERVCERDIGFKVITGDEKPDHTTIARFRQESGKGMEEMFTEALKLCAKAGLVKVGVVALDGTKMKADAALESNRTYEHIESEVKRMLAEAEAKDAEEDKLYGKDKRGDELPEELQDRRSRIERLKECKARLEQEKAERVTRQKEKIEEREKQESETGHKKRGRKPKDPDTVTKADTKANVTDPDSRIMKTRTGYVQGYNGQAVVTESQIIIAAELTSEENDIKQLLPMIEKADENIAGLELTDSGIGVVLADAGYCSDANMENTKPDGPECIIAVKKDWKQRQAIKEADPPRGRIPEKLSLRERMERKLLTKRGRTLYKKRGQIVEPVFGQIKTCRGILKFMRRGFEACAQEWKLICATHNLLKLWRSGKLAFNENC
jgi:transposase